MSSILDAAPTTSRVGSLAAVLGTAGCHGLLVLGVSWLGLRGAVELKRALPVTEMVEVELPKAEPPAPPEPEPERAVAPRPAPVARDQPPPSSAEPPPTAAQAGQVLDAKEVVDFGETFVTGAGSSYAGGVTDSTGISKNAVRDAAARGNAGGRGTDPAAAPVDRSRPPELVGGDSWNCPFPSEADDAGVDLAMVTLRLSVGVDGGVQGVSLVADPGNGFGREARRCAATKRFRPGLDRGGNPIAQQFTVNVRFRR
jgi:protein TonB